MTGTRRNPGTLYASEPPKRWAELREEELERANYSRKELAAWAKTHSLNADTLVVWLMPRKKAAELARHDGSDDSRPIAHALKDVTLLAGTEEEGTGLVLATVAPPEPEEEALIVTPPHHLRAWSMVEAQAQPSTVEALYLRGVAPGPGLARLTRLRILHLDQAPLTALPREVCGLAALEQLAISDTPLTALPEAIDQLQNLKHLSLSGGTFTTLPEALAGLPRLAILFCEDVALGPRGEGLALLRRLPALRRLDVRCRGPRPAWLKSFGALTKSEGTHPYVSFFAPGW